jgi:hypothetical protein
LEWRQRGKLQQFQQIFAELEAKNLQEVHLAHCSADQVRGQMQPNQILSDNRPELVNLLNNAVFDAAFLQDPSDPSGLTAARSRWAQCPQRYEDFLIQYNPDLKSIFESILSPCGAGQRTAVAGPQYPTAMPSRLSELGSETRQTVNEVLDTAIALCTRENSATECAGFAPGTERQIVKARLEVIRSFAHVEFASRFGRRDTTDTARVWRVVNAHLKAMESSN